jgi:hypothetical protein
VHLQRNAARSAKQTWQLCQRIRVLTRLQQCTAKGRCKRKQTWAAVPEDQSADSSATQSLQSCCRKHRKQTWAAVPEDQELTLYTVHCKGAATSANKHGSCVRGSECFDSSATQCTKTLQKRKQGQLCQRIRVLTPLQHSALQRNAARSAKQHGQLCQRIRC